MDYSIEIIEKNKRYSILNGAYSIIANSYGGFLSLYAINILNANHQQVGLLSSIPAIVSLLTTLIGGYWFSKLKMKKNFCGVSILSARTFIVFLAIIPFLSTNHAWFLLIIIGLMNIPGSLANLSWQSLIGDLIPEKDRGQFFSNRNRILTIVGMFSTAIIGFVLNQFDKAIAYPFQILFVIAFFFGVIESFYLFKHVELKEVETQDQQQLSVLSTMREMIKVKPFLFFLLSSMLFNFGWQMAWPLFSIYQIEYAKATAFWISLFTIANQFSQIMSFRLWGRLADKLGNSFALFLAALGMASAPFLTVLSTNLIYLTVINLFTGIFLAGTTLLLFNQLLHVSPVKNRSSYITQYTVMIGLIGFVAPQFGVWLSSIFGIYWSMHFSSVIRILGSVAFYIVAVKIINKDKKLSTM